MYLKITNGSIEINNKVILEDINFLIKNNEKVGLVGRNGSGKTTLLKGITGQLPFTDGYDKLNIEKDKFKIGYVSQENLTDPDTLLIDYIRSSYKEIINIEKNLESLEKEMSNSYKEETLIKYNDLLESYEFLGGYTYKKEYITA